MKKSISHLGKLIFKNKPLTIAFIISMLLHLIVLTKHSINSPAQRKSQRTFDVQLANSNSTHILQSSTPQAKTQALIKKAIVEEATLKIKPSSLSQLKDTNKTQEAFTQPPFTEVATDSSTLISNAAKFQTSTTDLQANNLPKAIPQQTIINTESQSTIITTQPSIDATGSMNYKQIETEFEVYQSTNPNTINLNKVLFTTRGKKGINESYAISDSSESALSKANISKGIISPSGLRPTYYETNDQYVNFAWSDGIISFNDKYEKLQNNTLDEISYMYQFMFTPPSDKTTIVLASGTQLITYEFVKLGDEILQTKLGDIKTVHLFSDGQEKIDLWLALDYKFIPVKIRKTEKDDTFTEKTVINLSTTLMDIHTQD